MSSNWVEYTFLFYLVTCITKLTSSLFTDKQTVQFLKCCKIFFKQNDESKALQACLMQNATISCVMSVHLSKRNNSAPAKLIVLRF